eukprot:scaffold41124_cov54-Attheya_sp.AAC.2
MQGIGKNRKPEERITGMNSMKFIHKQNVPKGKIVTYAQFVADIRPQKDEPHRMRLTVGGDRLPYDRKKSTETAGLETTKILITCFDIGNMYLNTKLPSPEFMKIHQSLIPQEVMVMDEYNVEQFLDENGYVYVEITRAIYGLAQSRYLANQDLIKNLAPCEYYPLKCTPGLWHHKTRSIKFSLVTDNFDWTGSKYIGIDLDWNYEAGEVKLSMKGYVQKALKEFLHHTPRKPVNRPTPYTALVYSKSVQYAPTEEAKTFTDKQIQHVQEVCGKFLYPAHTVDNTMLHALNELCIAATKGNDATAKALDHFMNYRQHIQIQKLSTDAVT